MKIEAMESYLGSLRVTRPPVDEKLSQIQGEILSLIENISIINHTKTRMTSGLVHTILQRRPHGK
jgi:hypothetical protein